MAMLMVDLKAIAETDKSPVTDCAIAVPSYFTFEERTAMLSAAQIAGVNCLRLLPDTTATALAYGIYKTDLPEKDPVNVVFVDVGFASLQVTPPCLSLGKVILRSNLHSDAGVLWHLGMPIHLLPAMSTPRHALAFCAQHVGGCFESDGLLNHAAT